MHWFNFPVFGLLFLTVACAGQPVGSASADGGLQRALAYRPECPPRLGFATVGGSGRHLSPPQSRIIEVTTLAADGTGSLREALRAKGPRTVVFRVGGIIDFRPFESLVINEPYLTVAGQTAPEPGISLYGLELIIKADQVVLQHLRFRPGDQLDPQRPKKINDKGWTQFSERDALKISASDVFIDHCSFSWATDELVQVRGNRVAFYRCLFGEGLDFKGHHKGAHSKGLIVFNYDSASGDSIAIYQNLFVRNLDRNPQISGGVSALIANNYVAHSKFGLGIVHQLVRAPGQEGGPTLSVVENAYFGVWKNPFRYVARPAHTRGQVFLGRQWIEGVPIDDPWALERLHLRPSDGWEGDPRNSRADAPPVSWQDFPLWPAESLRDSLLPHCGAFPKARDPLDQRLLEQAQMDKESKNKKMPATVAQAGGWPVLAERRGDLSLPTRPLTLGPQGYTRLEVFLQQRCQMVE